MRMLKLVCDGLESALRVVLCVLVTVMTVTVVWQVASRLLARVSVAYGLPLLIEPSRWTEELASFQLGWLALLGAAYALRKHEHLGFDFLYLKMRPAAQKWTERLVRGLVIAFSLVVLVYGGMRLVLMTSQLHQTTAGLQWPMAVIYGVIPVTGLLMAVFALDGGVFAPGESQLTEGHVEEAAL
jgi:TRAP-type C4-dicarboxylate transport system permease small subunit